MKNGGFFITAGQSALRLLLRVQSALTAPWGLLAKTFRLNKTQPEGYINGQAALKGKRLYFAKAEKTACEVIAVYNALIYLKKPADFSLVRSAFLSSGALTLFFFGFFGGNPFSLRRVLKRFGVNSFYTSPENTAGGCILSFFNPGSLSLHTVFCERRQTGLFAFNYYSADRLPRKIDPNKINERMIVCISF